MTTRTGPITSAMARSHEGRRYSATGVRAFSTRTATVCDDESPGTRFSSVSNKLPPSALRTENSRAALSYTTVGGPAGAA
ncbi:hypothetical protein C1861_08020 [Eggerthella lenta]|nr:hypothetical protein C1861_08020 [Eggerthella lenta]